jgi:hypothetical protein
MAIIHKIRTFLYKNELTPDRDDCVIRPITKRTLDVEDICESAASGGADISASAMEYAVNFFCGEMGYQLCDGFSVNAVIANKMKNEELQ